MTAEELKDALRKYADANQPGWQVASAMIHHPKANETAEVLVVLNDPPPTHRVS